MHSSLARRLSPLALILILTLFLGSITPVATLAQNPPPTSTPAPAPTATMGSDQNAPTAVEPVRPDGYIPPPQIRDLSNAELSSLAFPTQIQGDIKLDLVINPERIRAGSVLTYTYIITNTRNAPVSNILIRARWTNFKRLNTSGMYQYCKEIDCRPAIAADSLEAAIATDVAAPSDTEIVYRISSVISPTHSGHFSVVLNTRNDQRPLTGQTIKRPAGSGQLVESATTAPISEDTASSMIVGPVLVLTKTPATASKLINVGDTAEFTITIGNATATSDMVGTSPRIDAIPATNVILTDILPPGSEFISADGPADTVADPKVGPVRWVIPGPINPGSTYAVKVRFKKLDVNTECGTLANKTYNVTSDEVPIEIGKTTRYTVAGPTSSVTVRTPLVVSVPTIVPASPVFGTEATLTVQVQSYATQAIPNLEVHYTLQPNAWYMPGRAVPTPTSAPDGTSMGGEVIWKINMPAGTISAPASQTVTLVVRGDYTTGGTGTASVIAPQGLPSACIVPVNRGVSFVQRIEAAKLAGPDEVKNSSGQYVVRRKDTFTYLIQLQNKGVTDATDLIIDDILPSSTGADFSYISGSSTLDGRAYEPDPMDVMNGSGGSITWRSITVPAGQSASLQFNLTVDGNEFLDHCNTMNVTAPNELVKIIANKVCVRINPPIVMTKTASRTSIDGNKISDTKEVTFTLAADNQDSVPHDLALYDVGGNFAFVRMLNNGTDPTQADVNVRNYEWPRVTINPGQHYEVSFVAKLVPNSCANGNYNNDLNFRFWPSIGGNPVMVPSVPPARVTVQYLCGTTIADTNMISYSKTVDVAVVSLRDRHLFTISVKNENPAKGAARPNVEIVDVLPSGFTYVGMGVNSVVKDQPTVTTRTDGRVQMTWIVSSIAANASTTVQFYARSGDIVGTFTNWVRAKSDGMLGVKNCPVDTTQSCSGYLRVVEDGVTQIYATRDVRVEPMATLEPSIDKSVCALSGDARIYTVSLINSNRHAYSSTQVTVTLPIGLHLDSVSSTTPTPLILSQDERGTIVLWEKITLSQKPSNAAVSQIDLELNLLVGQSWDSMQPKVDASSPDGALPMKDGILDPTVNLCVPDAQPRIALDATKRRLVKDEEFYYLISLMNPGTTPVTLTVQDTLDSKSTYIATVQGLSPNTVNNGILTWKDIIIPAAASNGKPSVVTIIFRVKVSGAKTGDVIPNNVTVTQSSIPMSTDNGSLDVTIIDTITKIFLPFVKKK